VAHFPTKPGIPSANTRFGCQRNKSKTFTEQTELFVVAVSGGVFSVLTLQSLFSYPSSYLLHFPSFSCAIIHCSPSQLLFLCLLIHSLSYLHPHSSPTCHHTTPPSYTLSPCWLAYCTNHTCYQPSAIPDTRILITAEEIYPNTHKNHRNLYSNKFENIKEMDKFLDTYNHPKLNQEDINHLNRSITWNEIEEAIKSLLKKKSPGPDRFSAEFYQIFNFSSKQKGKEHCLTHSMKPV
jgi:hypothetical protein